MSERGWCSGSIITPPTTPTPATIPSLWPAVLYVRCAPRSCRLEHNHQAVPPEQELELTLRRERSGCYICMDRCSLSPPQQSNIAPYISSLLSSVAESDECVNWVQREHVEALESFTVLRGKRGVGAVNLCMFSRTSS